MNFRGSTSGMLALPERILNSQGFRSLVAVMAAALLVSLAALPESRSDPAQQPKPKGGWSLCYAFIRAGDVWTVCQGKRERIDFHGKALDFAASADGSYFAVQENLEPSGLGRARQLVVSLKPTAREKSRQLDYPESLYATCGTIVSFEPVTLCGFDLIASRPIQIPQYKYFRCSSDRQVVAGWTEQDKSKSGRRAHDSIFEVGKITLTVSGTGAQVQFTIDGPLEFGMSPDGRYVAYFTGFTKPNDYPKLCVKGSLAEPSCVHAQGGHVSVSDTGEVLYVTEPGIKYWRPGLKAAVLLEKGAGSPVWITPETVAALHDWKSGRTQGEESKR